MSKQIIQIARGSLENRLKELPLLKGEYFFDSANNYTLYIGTGTGNSWGYSENEVLDDNGNLVSNNIGGYIKINVKSTEIPFYSVNSNVTSNSKTIQDAIIALDSTKLSYKGIIHGFSKNVNYTLTSDCCLTGDDLSKIELASNLSNIEGGLYIIDDEAIINNIIYEKGDFLIFTSSKEWRNRQGSSTEKSLLVDDITLIHISGGTHDAAKIYITKEQLPRTETGDNIYGSEKINSVKDALQIVFKTKADLDNSGKIPINELPDIYLDGSYQGDTGAGFDNDSRKTSYWFDAMYREESQHMVLRDSFFQFIGNQIDGKDLNPRLEVKGYRIEDEEWKKQASEFLLAEAGTKSEQQVIPSFSGYILNSNSIIDGGYWKSNGDLTVYEGNGFVENKIIINRTRYNSNDETYEENIINTLEDY